MLILGIGEVFAQIGIWIVSGIYKVASTAFEIFLVLADGSLLASIDYNTIINNFYLVIAVIMLFVLAFSLLKGMVNPDDQKQGSATVKKVIINLITSVVIMAVLPTIFTFAFDFQKSFINDNNPIGKFFGYGSLDSNVSDNSNVDTVKYGANQIVNGVFTAFFNVNLEACEDDDYVDEDGNVNVKNCQASTNNDRLAAGNYSFATMMTRVERTGNFNLYEQFAEQVDDGLIDFNFLLSLIGGLLLIYVGVSYCFDMALRLVKLAFYQIIAPIPIFFRVIPEGKLSGTFNNWVKVTLTCYLEVYVRIFIFYFCIYLCKEMLSAPFFDNLSGRGFWVSNLSLAFVLMGIITFMKQAPKLISEITGLDSGNMKLGIRDKLKEGGFFAAGATVGGLIAGRGNPLAAYRAGKQGWKDGNFKGIGVEAKRRQDHKSALDSGATRRQMAWNSIRGAFGFDSTADAAERKIKTGATNVENNSANSIEYIDGKGVSHTILSGQNAKIDDVTAEELKAKKTQNIGAMTAANDKMRDLDKQIKWASSQKSWKSAMDDEADKKFNDGKYEHNIRYIDSNGIVHQEKVNGKRLSELSEQGMKFLYADESRDTFTAVYRDSSGAELVAKKKTQAELDELISRSGGSLVSKQVESVTEKKIRDEVRAVFSTDELSSDSPNLIKNKTEAFFTTLQNEGGFSYKSYVYDETGRQVYKDGKAVVETGGFTSKIDENNDRIITHTTVDSTGAEYTTTYKSIGNGMLEYIDSNGDRKEMSVYDLSDMFDQKSKSTTGVLEVEKQAIAEGQDFIRARDENDAIDAILKQRDEKIAQALQSEKQRGREAAKKYTANRK